MKTVYLCGPITGLSYEGATDWRDGFKNKLKENIETLSPMRGKLYLLGETFLHPKGYADSLLSSAKSITTRDRFDTTRCDVMVANLLGATRVSIGSMIEFGWADAARVPIVMVMEPEGNVHDHGMVTELAGFRVKSLDEAADVVNSILGSHD